MKVKRPSGVELHFEVELAVIIGREVRDLPEGDKKTAMDAIDCMFFFVLDILPSIFFWLSEKKKGKKRG